jgi:hypothetical protein
VLLNDPIASEVPMFEIGAEKVTGVPVIADVGVTEPALRFGALTVTVAVASAGLGPVKAVHLRTYEVFVTGETVVV